VATSKLDIKRELAAVDSRDYNFYNKLTPEEKKAFSPFVLMRFISNIQNNDRDYQEWFLQVTNERVNKHHWDLSKNHKELLWKLCAGVGIGEKFYHPYLAAGKKGKVNKIEKLIGELNPAMKLSDIKMISGMMTTKDIKELFDNMGFDKKQQKEYE